MQTHGARMPRRRVTVHAFLKWAGAHERLGQTIHWGATYLCWSFDAESQTPTRPLIARPDADRPTKRRSICCVGVARLVPSEPDRLVGSMGCGASTASTAGQEATPVVKSVDPENFTAVTPVASAERTEVIVEPTPTVAEPVAVEPVEVKPAAAEAPAQEAQAPPPEQEPEAEVAAELKPEPAPAVAELAAQPEPTPEPEASPEPEVTPEPEVAPGPEAAAEPEAEVVAEPEAATAEPEVEAAAEAAAEPADETEAAAEPEPVAAAPAAAEDEQAVATE